MMNSMTITKSKITITIDRGVLSRVKAAVAEGQAASVSAYVEHLIVGQLAAEARFDATITEMLETTGGAPTAAEREVAQRLLSSSPT